MEHDDALRRLQPPRGRKRHPRPLHGALLDRFGPRKVASAGVVILGLGFMLFSRVQEPWQFYAAFLVIAVGASMSGFLTATFAAVHWFERRRATAISLTSAGFAIGGMCVPLTVLALESLGGRTTALLSGVLIIAAGLPLARLYRHHPHELGLEPDGGPPAAARRATGGLGARRRTATSPSARSSAPRPSG
ncbi:MFS transporter [Tepidiforma thermophila]|uniref:MFS transporter n=1 Tax=Tepidiforma thermophila (strain KCTC 52669 / CGMCC 1.13589 / G233) TaxID=2761530 RepID=UPI000BFA314B|nr:MFS transporter [Tepidiforma thermophila]